MALTNIVGSIYNAATGVKVTAGQLIIQPDTFILDDGQFYGPKKVTVSVSGGDVDFSLAPSHGVYYTVEFDPDPDDTTTALACKDGYFKDRWLVPVSGSPVDIADL